MFKIAVSLFLILVLSALLFGADMYIPKSQNGQIITHELEVNE